MPGPGTGRDTPLPAIEAGALLRRALEHGGERADLFLENSTAQAFELRQRASSATIGTATIKGGCSALAGASLRVHRGEEAFFAASPEATPEGCEALAHRILAVVRTGRPEASDSIGPAPSAPCDPEDVASIETLLRAATDAAFSLDERVASVHVRYMARQRNVYIGASDGAAASLEIFHAGLRLGLRLETDTGPVDSYAITGSADRYDDLETLAEHTARAAVEGACVRAAARPMTSGEMPVVIAGGWGGVWLHEAMGHMLEADTAAAWAPELLGRIGTAVAAPNVTLVDDPTWPGGRGSSAVDDEGTPASRTVLIEDGILRYFLTDYRNARHWSLPRTGHARRQDYRFQPMPRMSNLLLQPGESRPEDLFADIADGLFVTKIGEGVCYPGQDRFSFEVLEGYRIEQGRVTHPVTGARLEGGGRELWQGIAGVGNDFEMDHARGLCEKGGQVVPVSVGMPTVLCRKLQVVG